MGTRTNRMLAVVAVAALGSIAVVTGCGGDDEPAAAPTALTATEFRTQADALCAATEKELDALGEPSAPGEVAAFLAKGLTVNAAGIDKLRALAPPAELKADFDAALALLDQRQQAIKEVADKVTADPTSAEAAINAANANIEGLQQQAREKAKALGLTVCGSE